MPTHERRSPFGTPLLALLAGLCAVLALLAGPAGAATAPEHVAEAEVAVGLPGVALAARRGGRSRRLKRATGSRPSSHASPRRHRTPVAVGHAPEPSTGPPDRRGPPRAS